MDTLGVLYLAWPFIGLGGAIVLTIVLFATNACRSNLDVSRWRDPVWLAWCLSAAYLFHVFEEYGAYISDGQFALITNFEEMGVSERFGGIPYYFFPYVNILFTWVALPIAAVIARRNPVIGLASVGFLLVNGLVHIGSFAISGGGSQSAPGAITGIVFLSLVVWICYACAKYKLLPKRGLTIALVSGIIGHLCLFSCYIINMLLGHVASTLWVPVVAFSPLLIAWLLCKIFHVRQVSD